MWASVEEVDILVSCRAIRSGGREEEARSVNAVEFLAFNRDRILREYRVNVSFEDLGGRREKGQFGPGLISTSPERRRMKTIFRRELTTGGRNGDAQAALEFCPIHCRNGGLGQDLGFGGFAFALKLPELLNRNLAAVRAKLGQTSCFPNGPQIWCPKGQ